MIKWLEAGEPFPPVAEALDEPEGLLAAGGDLSPGRLIDAYRHGIFPWFNADQPPLWWSTNPRMVLFTSEFDMSRSLAKKIASLSAPPHPRLEIRCDSEFETVMRACAAPRSGQDGTWISESMIDAYLALHALGVAHSIEAWIDGELAGGLYGLAIGRMFFGESMFTRVSDASKIALAALISFLRQHEFPMIDCQQQTAHLASLGARPIRRDEFIAKLEELVVRPEIGSWPATLSLG